MYVYVSMRAKALQAYIALPWFLEMVLIWFGHCISEKWMFFILFKPACLCLAPNFGIRFTLNSTIRLALEINQEIG